VIFGFRRGVNEIVAVLGCVRGVDWKLFADVSGQPIGPEMSVTTNQRCVKSQKLGAD
jgi:hypothetical protein